MGEKKKNRTDSSLRENGKGTTGNFKISVLCCNGYLARMADMYLLFVDPVGTQKAKRNLLLNVPLSLPFIIT